MKATQRMLRANSNIRFMTGSNSFFDKCDLTANELKTDRKESTCLAFVQWHAAGAVKYEHVNVLTCFLSAFRSWLYLISSP